MNSHRRRLAVILAIGIIAAGSCDSDSETGFLLVSVIDVSGTPVSGAEVRVLPVDRIKSTDADGLTLFVLDPGNYFVDAQLCCSGTGTIDYHEPVRVRSGKTVNIELQACLACG